jgi:signal-transduction protein with cAMP-binding, CBS, and nucleotidyltransferase domain
MSTSGPRGAPPKVDTARSTKVRQLMRPAATTVEPRAHLAAAAYLMKKSGGSALVVTTDDGNRRPLGIVTDSDISQAVADERDLEQMRISDLLGRDMVEVAPGTPVDEAARLMLDRDLHHLLVVEDGQLVGIVDVMDVCRALMADP